MPFVVRGTGEGSGAAGVDCGSSLLGGVVCFSSGGVSGPAEADGAETGSDIGAT